jgi:hypothetical protein
LLASERKIAMADIRNSEWFGQVSELGNTPTFRLSPHSTNGMAL